MKEEKPQKTLKELLDVLITTKAEVRCALENAHGCGEQELKIQKGTKDFIILTLFDSKNIELPPNVACFDACRPEWLTGRVKEAYKGLTSMGFDIKILCCTDTQGKNFFFCLAMAV